MNQQELGNWPVAIPPELAERVDRAYRETTVYPPRAALFAALPRMSLWLPFARPWA